MQRAGYCSVCNENVFLTESGECSKGGHPSNCITGVYDVQDSSQAQAPGSGTANTPVAVSKPKKPLYKKWWVWVAGIVVLGAIASAAGGGGESSNPTKEASTAPEASASAPSPKEAAAPEAEPAAQEEKVAKIGDPLKVGELVFTVENAKVTKKLSSPLGNKKGNWMLVTVTVKNNSKEAVMVNTDFFKLIESDGTTYETDSDNIMYVDSEQSFFLENINPKLEKTGKALFAIPEGAKDFKLQVQTGFWGTETGEIALKK